jgi:hypothetical protein
MDVENRLAWRGEKIDREPGEGKSSQDFVGMPLGAKVEFGKTPPGVN